MLIIRLQRVGRKNDPSFRLIVIDSKKAAKKGVAVEILGSYNPIKKTTALKPERIKYWLSVGAQTSASARNILVNNKVIDSPKVNKAKKPKPLTKPAGGV